MKPRLLITGGAGFIGSALVRHLIGQTESEVLVVDKLTYAGTLDSLAPVSDQARFHFAKVDIADTAKIKELFETFRPGIVMHLAAESHVDRSIDGPAPFIQSNVVGTFCLLQAALSYWRALSGAEAAAFRFLHVSTDEVFGSLGQHGLFTEESSYDPKSPYAASKAASDHLVRSWHHTYGLPVVISNCSNNYGPYHFPEKLIPLVIINALQGKPIPVYGKGENVRDWLYVDDHVRALLLIATKGKVGESYNIGGTSERSNLEVVKAVCALIDEVAPSKSHPRHDSLISFVDDRPGHDLRYAMDTSKIKRELGWAPLENFDSGLRKTVNWFIDNRAWWERRSATYRGERLGLNP